jgi:hypothetical protein
LERLQNFFKHHHFAKTDLNVPSPLRLSNIWIGLRVLFLLCIVDSDRRYYWNLIFWTIRFNHKFLDKAFLYSIMMYQMKKGHATIYNQVKIALAEEAKANSVAA